MQKIGKQEVLKLMLLFILIDVEVMPRNDWGGDSLLGTHIRFDKHHCSDECMINVLVYLNIFIFIFNFFFYYSI